MRALRLTSLGLVALLSAIACQGVLGIEDTTTVPSGADGGGTGGTGGTAATGGSAGVGGAVGGVAGTDGSTLSDFTFNVLPVSVSLPLDGLQLVPVEIQRQGSFTGDVSVDATSTSGLTWQTLTIPAGETSGEIQLSAALPLALDDEFDLQFDAVGGEKTHSDSAHITIVHEPGTFDTSFGGAGTGIAKLNNGAEDGSYWKDIAVLTDDRIVGVGQEVLLNNASLIGLLQKNGTLDLSFAGTGLRGVPVCSPCNGASNVSGVGVVPSNNYLLIASAKNQDLGFTILQPNGVLDPIFYGTGYGFSLVNYSGTEESGGVIGFADGGSLYYLESATSNGQTFLFQRNASGNPKSSFGTAGRVDLAMNGVTHSSMARIGSGRIYVAGVVPDTGGKVDTALHALTATGTLDPAFDGDGELSFGSATEADIPAAVAVQSDGKVLVGGYTGSTLWVRRFDASGAPDATFGTSGVATLTAPPGSETVDIALQTDGKILIATRQLLVGRFRADGKPDPTWGTNGIITVDLGVSGELAALAIQSTGQILIGGQIDNEPSYEPWTMVARLWN